MEKKYLTYREVIYVIEFCMKDRSFNAFFDKFACQAGEEKSKLDAHVRNDLLRFHRPLNDDAIDVLQNSVDYSIMKDRIETSKDAEALDLLNSAIEAAGFKEKFKQFSKDLPKLIIQSLLFADEYYKKHKDEIETAYMDIPYVSPKLPKNTQVLKRMSSSFAIDLRRKRARYKLTEIKLNLLSKGALSVKGKANNEIKDLMDFLNEDKDLLILGEGGIGKTTFLFHVLDTYLNSSSYIPFYFSLTKLKATGDEPNDVDSHFIKDALTKKASLLRFKDFDIDKAISGLKGGTKVLLLLDGINEISVDHSSRYRHMLLNEIERFSNTKGVKVIATSRPFNNSTACLVDALHIEATGLETQTVKNCLRKSKLNMDIPESLMSILKIPLFLLMYISDENHRKKDSEHGYKEISNKGAILYEYFNSDDIELYTEAFIQKELTSIDKDMPDYIAPLNDFFFPAVASIMHQEDSLSITQDELENILWKLDDLMISALATHDNHYCKYAKALTYPSFYARKIMNSCAKDVNVQELLIDRLSFLQPDYNDSYSFVHQHIRDYFAAIMNLNAILLSSDKMTKLYKDALSYGWTVDVIEFMKEVYLYTESFISVDDILDKLRFFSLAENKSFIAISNLLYLLSAIYNKDLSTLTFDNIDFSRCDFNSINFHNPLNGTSTVFNNCSFSEDTFKSQYNQKNYSVFYEFYHNKPVYVECYENAFTDERLVVCITDMLSGYLISSYTYSLKDTDLPFSSIIFARVSNDLKYITFIFADDNSALTSCIICELMIDDNMFCKRNIIHISDPSDSLFTLFYKTNGDLVIATDLPSFDIYDFKQNKLIPGNKFDSNDIPDYDCMRQEDRAPLYKQISDDKYIMIYPVRLPDRSTAYYLITFDIAKSTKNVSKTFFQFNDNSNICVSDNYLFAMSKGHLEILDLDSFNPEPSIPIYPIDVPIGQDYCISVHNGYIYMKKYDQVVVINLSDHSDVIKINIDTKIQKFHDYIIAENNKYILYGNDYRDQEMTIFRISQGSFYQLDNSSVGFICHACINDLVPVIYEKGQLSLVSFNDMSLIDNYIFTSHARPVFAYDNINQLLAISIREEPNTIKSTIYLFDVSSMLKKLKTISTDDNPTIVFDGKNKLFYYHDNGFFYVYDMSKGTPSCLIEEEACLQDAYYAEYTNGVVRFYGEPWSKYIRAELEKCNFLCELSYKNNKLTQTLVTLPEAEYDRSKIAAVRRGVDYYHEVYLKDDSSCAFEDSDHMTKYDINDITNYTTIPLNTLKQACISVVTKYHFYLPQINDNDERNYSFKDDGDGMIIYRFGQNDEQYYKIYSAKAGDYTHIKGDILISAFSDNALFKYDLKSKKCLKYTEYTPNINIVNAKFNNPDCSEKVIEILKDNGADL